MAARFWVTTLVTRYGVWPLVLLAIVGLLSGLWLWQKTTHIQKEFERRALESGTQAMQAKVSARQAQEDLLAVSSRLALLEARLGEVSLQRGQLEELMQSLTRSRDENLVVDIDSALRLAQQQAELTGSAEPLLAALKSADQRLARTAQPRLNPLRRALANDLDRVKSAAVMDIPALLNKLDDLTRMVEDLPLVNGTPKAAGSRDSGRALDLSPELPSKAVINRPTTGAVQGWWLGVWQEVQNQTLGLLRVSRIEHPEAALLAPEQTFFLRENLKLKLLNARMALLSRRIEAARTGLIDVQSGLSRYFDPTSQQTQTAAVLLQQITVQIKPNQLPRLDESMAALLSATTGR